jgi:N-acetylmuramoyl-L-alanine amidase
MQTFLLFLFKSGVTAGIMFAYYWLFLKDRKLNKFNRFYLLASVGLSLVVPMLHFEWYRIANTQSNMTFKVLRALNSAPGEDTVVKGSSSLFNVQNIVIAVYVLGGITVLGMLIAKVRWVYKLKYNNIVANEQGFKLILTESNRAPFSFLNNLFWRADIDMKTETGQQILKHELTHIKERHTLDKLFVQAVAAVLWLNPFYWLVLRELSNIHEFIADEASVEEEDTEAFAVMILQSHYHSALLNVIQPFFYSPIKRRLTMINKPSKTSYSRLRRFMLLPLLCVPVLLFSFKINDANVVRAKKRAVVIVDAGHGGRDIGGTGINGLKEKDLTLAMTEKLVALSGQYNLDVASTRKEDHSMPLEDRVALSNKETPDVFISVHVNKHEAGEKMPDYQVYVSDKSPKLAESEVFASAMISSLQAADVKPVLSQKHLWVLTANDAPAILIECGDIDNAKQMALLTDDRKQEQLCRNILSGVVRYVNSK